MSNDNFQDTMQFRMDKDDNIGVHKVLLRVYHALKQKGYDPINQIVGYILSGDPTYITSYDNARYILRKFERDEILEELVRFYIEFNDARAEIEKGQAT